MISICNVILCGGSGTRLWPLSRAGFPKQFLSLFEDESLFQQAVRRLNDLSSTSITVGKTLIVTNEQHRFLALDQLKDFKAFSFELLLEPDAKNTAPALTFAAMQGIEANQDPILVVTPADQIIQDELAYQKAINRAVSVASLGHIVILGIKPTKPETGFGYIKCHGDVGVFSDYSVDRFVEKPSLSVAENYLASGRYFWNSGIFVVRASRWLEAIKHFRPDVAQAVQNSFKSKTQEHQFIRPDPMKFAEIPSVSIDYAVIEKCPGSAYSLRMIPLDAGWNDLGAWDAVWELATKDKEGNSAQGDVVLQDSRNNLVNASHRLVSLMGVDNLVVVETPDALLIGRRDRSQDVKCVVNQLMDSGREEAINHRKVIRPWGWYDTIDVGNRFKVKRIQVNPGASLSLQSHSKRAEHWVVVRGVAEVNRGDITITLHENESTYIPVGEKHRLANPGEVPLEIIEVQTGAYLGEDDIVRFKDCYGRN